MRLKSIKLAGFKSFVDATTVPFPTNMTAVVGPNGCGKSNIIDAVRWVMGESSAKYLRGESMTDVIFNGSSARKPVSQASIELVFDNSDGTAPGEHAAFSEISVRRRVSREGQSDYFLNGTKCRRRDITDLFLGTGLGPRSYAIIEQGMISRLIEAKPEELRIYIEEAAGISKYKERRRETENRMRRTVENLERLTDLRDELGRQLEHLQKQAQAAEKYKAFKQQERKFKAELATLRWQAVETESEKLRGQQRQTELELERALTDRLRAETELESLRDDHQQRTDAFSKAQARYYEAGADIARIEQKLENQRQRSRQVALEQDQAAQNLRELQDDLARDQEKLDDLQAQLTELEPQHQLLTEAAEESAVKLQEAEEAMARWQQQWDEFSARSADARREAELAQSRIRSADDAMERLQERQRRLEEEQQLLEGQLDREAIAELEAEESELSEQQALVAEQIEEGQFRLDDARERLTQAEAVLNDVRQGSQKTEAALESQRQLLAEQLGSQDQALQRWLGDAGLSERIRVLEQLDIAPGWERAVEEVLGTLAQGICVDAITDHSSALVSAPKGAALIAGQSSTVPHTEQTADSPEGLLSLVGGAGALAPLLAQAQPIDSIQQALGLVDSLKGNRFFVTPDGALVGPGWLKMPDSEAGHIGVIERQRRVDDLQAEYERLKARLADAEASRVEASEQVQTLEQQRDTLQADQREQDQRLSTIRSRLSGLRARADQIESRLARLSGDRQEVGEQLAEQREALDEAREIWQEALARNEQTDLEKQQLVGDRDYLRSTLDHCRHSARADREQAHQAQLSLQTLSSQQQGLKQTQERLHLQRERLEERLDMLRESREEAEAPQEDLQLELEGLLERRLAEEDKVAAARSVLEDIEQQVRDRETRRHQAEQSIGDVRTRLERLKLESQAQEIKGQHLVEQLRELDADPRNVSQELPPEATEASWAEELERIGGRIQRLGAINLAAIEEYEVQSERKVYLDSQNDDLVEALETLETAIRRIDRETRQRFKETYDKVNHGLQTLFPKVFGGGSATLELTGDDLLETGVSIMARPPGKKNSTIHLLSGGEKALTAIALVFSIFQLNPAPFCMLDEVDAPLDDANVGRYADMVREMASQVQFIYITHNKIAMEMAEQLMGVTMHEPGCSRLVSVDVEEAAALASA